MANPTGSFTGKTGRNNETGKRIKDYVYNYSDIIGRGNFAKVYRGTNEKTKETVAIKIVSLDSLKSKKLEALIFEEIRILQQMNHPNILRFHEALMSDRNCYIITELCNEGDLANKIREKYSLHERDIGCYITDICQGLLYLREMKVIHRDLKPANVFLHNGRAKIADFGLAKISSERFTDLDIGSPLYMSPQGLIHHVYSEKTDIWAFGILIYEMLHGETPFCSCTTEEEIKYSTSCPLPEGKFRQGISPEMKKFILLLLDTDERKRPSIFQLIEDPFLKELIQNEIGKNSSAYFNRTNRKYNNATKIRRVTVSPNMSSDYQLGKYIPARLLPNNKLQPGQQINQLNQLSDFVGKKIVNTQEKPSNQKAQYFQFNPNQTMPKQSYNNHNENMGNGFSLNSTFVSSENLRLQVIEPKQLPGNHMVSLANITSNQKIGSNQNILSNATIAKQLSPRNFLQVTPQNTGTGSSDSQIVYERQLSANHASNRSNSFLLNDKVSSNNKLQDYKQPYIRNESRTIYYPLFGKKEQQQHQQQQHQQQQHQQQQQQQQQQLQPTATKITFNMIDSTPRGNQMSFKQLQNNLSMHASSQFTVSKTSKTSEMTVASLGWSENDQVTQQNRVMGSHLG